MARQEARYDTEIRLTDLSGGINNTDPIIPENQCADARNIEWPIACVGRRRNGADSSNGFDTSFSAQGWAAAFRHTPTDEIAAEAWVVGDGAIPVVGRATSNVFAAVTISDALTQASVLEAVAVSYNGKLFLAWDTAQNRLHVWDGTSIRRVGLPTPGSPTAANQGAGAYAAVIRYYRVRWLHISGSLTVRRSEAGASISFTPSGAGASVRVTQPSPPGEGETHWELEASADGVNFFRIALSAIGTTFFDDSALVTSYSSNSASPETGLFLTPWSAKYLLVDSDRLLFAGSWEETSRQSSVGWTPILGTLNNGDDERITTTTTLTSELFCEPSTGGPITAFAGPINGEIYAFKRSRIYRLVRTTNAATPYARHLWTDKVGAINNKSVRMGEDEAGNPALYFLSTRGPYRIGSAGLEYLGRDIEKQWKKVQIAAGSQPPFGEYNTDRGEMWWFVPFSTGMLRITFAVKYGRRTQPGIIQGGWGFHDGVVNQGKCAFAFDSLPTTANRTGKLKVWTNVSGSLNTLVRHDTENTSQDQGATNFRAYVLSGRKRAGTAETLTAVEASWLMSVPEGYTSNKTLAVTATVRRNYGQLTSTTAAKSVATQTEASPPTVATVEGIKCSGNTAIQFELGNAAAADEVFQIDEAVLRLMQEATVLR